MPPTGMFWAGVGRKLTLLITPSEIVRMPELSAKYTLLAESVAMQLGWFNCALVAGPPSPLKPGAPFPATVSDHSVRDFAYAVVAPVCNIQVAGGVHGDAQRIVQLGLGGGPAIAAEALRSISRHSSDHSVRD